MTFVVSRSTGRRVARFECDDLLMIKSVNWHSRFGTSWEGRFPPPPSHSNKQQWIPVLVVVIVCIVGELGNCYCLALFESITGPIVDIVFIVKSFLPKSVLCLYIYKTSPPLYCIHSKISSLFQIIETSF
jgi:hypothetical protein